ncbi:MAG: acetyl-CoA hydrolase/transferase C-terminal domain-containing protein [Gammaproteobacteria bacterium]
MQHATLAIHDVESCVDHILATVGKRIVLGVPLGLGKPNSLVNAIYHRAKADPSISLEILTALSLERPQPHPGLEARFMGPFVERVFGDYVDLEYMKDIRAGTIPANVHVSEFFFKSGALLGNAYAQQHYISTNYTYAPRDILARGVNVLAQLVAKRETDGPNGRETRYSLSCNPETTLDMYPHIIDRKQRGEQILTIGMVHDDLPFMVNDAEVSPNFFDVMIDHPQHSTRLFGAPNMSIATPDYFIGLHTSTLLRDGGTLQIGIGSLGDAIAYASILRNEQNDAYRAVLRDAGALDRHAGLIEREGGLQPFSEGLYGSSEMFVNAFWELMKAGILRRRVYDHLALQTLLSTRQVTEKVDRRMVELLVDHGVRAKLNDIALANLQRFGILRDDVTLDGTDLLLPDGTRVPANLDDERTLSALEKSGLGDTLKGGIVMHGGFLLGPTSLYEAMRHMNEEQRAAINMTRISYTNALYGQQELKHLQRRDARFVNTVFTATLLGAAVSDGLPNGQVVSGVGGQYNFVAMAHELPGARSILLLRSTRNKGGEVSSNIVFNYGHVTIPRHLRDIYITEYGIADLRAKTDAEVIAAMLNVADSRFQPQLLAEAKAAGKIAEDYEIPEVYRHNLPERLEQALAPHKAGGHFPPFPFGHDFTEEELALGKALKKLKAVADDKLEFLKKLLVSTTHPHVPEQLMPYLRRMDMEHPTHMRDKLEQLLLVEALCEVLGIER